MILGRQNRLGSIAVLLTFWFLGAVPNARSKDVYNLTGLPVYPVSDRRGHGQRGEDRHDGTLVHPIYGGGIRSPRSRGRSVSQGPGQSQRNQFAQ